ncbi:MAG: PKD domain-containing protein, partial [Bacteroidia bacterium]
MKNSDNIEKLFKDTFDRFEADVNPKVWTNVQSGIKSFPGGAASGAAKFAIGKIIAGAASVAVIAGSVWYFASSDNKVIPPAQNKQAQTETVPKEPVQNIAADNQSSGTSAGTQEQRQKNSPVSSSTKNSSGNSSQKQVVVNNSTKDNKTDTSVTEKTAAASSQSNSNVSGNTSNGDNRSAQNQGQNTASKSQKENPSSDNQDDRQAPTAAISASTESGDWPLTVTFNSQGTANTLSWNFGDGTTSNENSLSHTFEKPGNYTVILVAKNSNGTKPVSDKVTIEVKPISGILSAPNIFSPNGDNIND